MQTIVKLSEIEKQQRAVLSAIHARRSGSCNRSQLGRELPLYNRGLIGRVLEELLGKKWIVDVSTNSAFRYRVTPEGGRQLDRLNRQFWVEIGEWERVVAQDKRDARRAKPELVSDPPRPVDGNGHTEPVHIAGPVPYVNRYADLAFSGPAADELAPEPTRLGYAEEGRWAFEQATSALQRSSNLFALAEIPQAANIAAKAAVQLDLFAQQLDLFTSADYLARLAK